MSDGRTAWNMIVFEGSENLVDYFIDRPFSNRDAVIFDCEESCVICYFDQPSLIFLPCRHKIVCRSCLKTNYYEFKKCPMCKTEIDFVYTVKIEARSTRKDDEYKNGTFTEKCIILGLVYVGLYVADWLKFWPENAMR